MLQAASKLLKKIERENWKTFIDNSLSNFIATVVYLFTNLV